MSLLQIMRLDSIYFKSGTFVWALVLDMLTYWTQNTTLRLVLNCAIFTYRQTTNISRTSVDNEIVDDSDVVGASPVGAAPTISSFST